MPRDSHHVGMFTGRSKCWASPLNWASFADGTKVSNPRFLRRAEKKLGRLQRAHSRKQKGSRNREKSRARLARAHATVANRPILAKVRPYRAALYSSMATNPDHPAS